MTESKRTPQEYATWADVLKGLAVLAVVVVFVHIGRQDTTIIQEQQKKQKAEKILDSLVTDSLSKTTEYQNAIQATRAKEQKENEIRHYFDLIQKSY